MTYSQAEIDDWYERFTKYINDNSGLEPLVPDQVKWVWRTHRKMIKTYDNANLSQSQSQSARKYVPKRKCIARRTDGEPCQRPALNGAQVCRSHGGAAKQVRNAARIRLENATDRMAKELLNMATDDNISDATKLRAITEALDRGGLSIKTEVEITAKPYESIFEQLSGGSREAHRNSQGIEDDTTPALVAAKHEPIDAQIVDDFNDDGVVIVDDSDDDGAIDLSYYAQPITPERDGSDAVVDSGRFGPISAPPADGLMSLVDANAEIRRLRTQAATGSTQIHRAQRALPPGRSAR